MNKSQSMTWELLLILGIVLLLVSPIGDWLGSIVSEIATHHDVSMTFNPFAKVSTTTTQGGSSGPIGHYTIPLLGGGDMTVNANSQQAAIENVRAQGGTPA